MGKKSRLRRASCPWTLVRYNLKTSNKLYLSTSPTVTVTILIPSKFDFTQQILKVKHKLWLSRHFSGRSTNPVQYNGWHISLSRHFRRHHPLPCFPPGIDGSKFLENVLNLSCHLGSLGRQNWVSVTLMKQWCMWYLQKTCFLYLSEKHPTP